MATLRALRPRLALSGGFGIDYIIDTEAASDDALGWLGAVLGDRHRFVARNRQADTISESAVSVSAIDLFRGYVDSSVVFFDGRATSRGNFSR